MEEIAGSIAEELFDATFGVGVADQVADGIIGEGVGAFHRILALEEVAGAVVFVAAVGDSTFAHRRVLAGDTILGVKLGVAPKVRAETFAHGQAARVAVHFQYRLPIDPDGGEPVDRVVVVGDFVAGGAAAADHVAHRVVAEFHGEFALGFRHEPAFGIEGALDFAVRALGGDEVAGGIVGETFEAAVGKVVGRKPAQRVAVERGAPPQRVDAVGELSGGIVAIGGEAAPVIHLVDDAPGGVALEVVALAPSVDDAYEAVLSVVVVADGGAVGQMSGDEAVDVAVFEACGVAQFVHVAREVEFAVVGAANLGAGGFEHAGEAALGVIFEARDGSGGIGRGEDVAEAIHLPRAGMIERVGDGEERCAVGIGLEAGDREAGIDVFEQVAEVVVAVFADGAERADLAE